MMRRGEFVSDEHYLQMHANPYRFTLADYLPLNREKSATHWETRKPSRSEPEPWSAVNQPPGTTAEKDGPSPAVPVSAMLRTSLISSLEVLRVGISQNQPWLEMIQDTDGHHRSVATSRGDASSRLWSWWSRED